MSNEYRKVVGVIEFRISNAIVSVKRGKIGLLNTSSAKEAEKQPNNISHLIMHLSQLALSIQTAVGLDALEVIPNTFFRVQFSGMR